MCRVPVFKMAAIFKMAAVLSENLRKNVEIDTLKVLFPSHRRVPVTIMLSGRLSGHSSTHTHIRPVHMSIRPSVCSFVHPRSPLSDTKKNTFVGFCAYLTQGHYVRCKWCDKILAKSAKSKGQRTISHGIDRKLNIFRYNLSKECPM